MNDTNKKISQNRLKKEELVKELTTKTEKAKGLVFTNYQGLTHQQLEGLKKALKKLDAEYVSTKNTLLLLALKDKLDTESEKDKFRDPTATLFMYSDIVEPLKHLNKTIKELSLPSIKFGFLEGKVMTDQEVTKIASLPPLQVLQAQLLGNMKGPISGFHRALSWNITKLALTLKAIEKTKQATSQTS
jgi:large subunit ribosomal protein L10